MAKKLNWEARNHFSLGPKFRIDTNNPQMGAHGPNVYDIYAVTDNKEVNIMGLSSDGTFRLYNDRTIEIAAGYKNENGVDIKITGLNGDVCITAMRNGRVRIKAKNIILDADEDIDLKAGRNLTIDSGSRILMKGNILDQNCITGNLVPQVQSFAGKVFDGTFVGSDVVSTFTNVAATLF
jgi:hypothetical protein